MNTSTSTDALKHGWISSPSGRGTYDIILTCFFTIFVCTFTVLHLNVPSSDDRKLQILLRKIKWMVFAIVIPEVVTASAFVQRVAARDSVKSMKAIQYDEWTMRHAFYWNMGGAWLLPKDAVKGGGFPINAIQQNYLMAKGILEKPPLEAEEIWDKSKVDRFAKLLACLQIGWLSLQCVGRAAQHLPMSVLEIGTVGFAIPSLATFALWFNKPNDIATTTKIRVDLTLAELLEKLNPMSEKVWHDTPLDFISTVNKPSFVSEIALKTPNWPGRKRFDVASTRIRNDVFALKYSKLDQLFVCAVWISYGGIHLAAWNFDFPSQTEKTLWRVSCIVMTAAMAVFWITGNRKFYLLFAYLMPSRRKRMEAISNERAKVSSVQIILGAVTGLSYLVARVCLIVEALISLRALPAGAFQTIDWWGFVPHVQ